MITTNVKNVIVFSKASLVLKQIFWNFSKECKYSFIKSTHLVYFMRETIHCTDTALQHKKKQDNNHTISKVINCQ